MTNNYWHTRIEKIIEENENVRTFVLNVDFKSRPGQFVMAWLPGIDEKPLSLSSPNTLTVKKVGPFTEELFKKTKGSYLDVKGVYGNGFPTDGTLTLIGGGMGIAPLSHFLYVPGDVSGIVLAGRKKPELLFLDSVTDAIEHEILGGFDSKNLVTVTDDGSFGIKGIASAAPIPEADKYLICGPEVMMKDVADKLVGEGVGPERIFLSMERYMKCAVGVCGNCSFEGYRVCADGPVFSYDKIGVLPHFNEFGRSRTGELMRLTELHKKS